MTDMIINEEKSSRKKILVPLVVLLLCGVALTGAAYAYTATLAVSGNNAEAGYLTIDLNSGTNSTTTDVSFTGDNVVTYTDNFTYSALGGSVTKKNIIEYEFDDAVDIVTYKVNIARESGNTDKVKLTAALNDFGNVKVYVGGTATALNTLGTFTFTLKDTNNADKGTIALSSDTGYINNLDLGVYLITLHFVPTAATSSGDAYGEQTYSSTHGTISDTGALSGYLLAKDLQGAFNAQTFGITFTAEPAVTTP